MCSFVHVQFCMHVLVCAWGECLGGLTCHGTCVEVKRQFGGVSSLLPLWVPWDQPQGVGFVRQTESSHQPTRFCLVFSVRNMHGGQ